MNPFNPIRMQLQTRISTLREQKIQAVGGVKQHEISFVQIKKSFQVDVRTLQNPIVDEKEC